MTTNYPKPWFYSLARLHLLFLQRMAINKLFWKTSKSFEKVHYGILFLYAKWLFNKIASLNFSHEWESQSHLLMEALQRCLSLPLSRFTIILWIIIYNLCKLWERKKTTLERRVPFSEVPYGVKAPEVHLGDSSSGRVGSMKWSRERQGTASEVRPRLTS